MATPNYSFEKRKREMAKKAAKEAKKLRKQGEKSAATDTDAAVVTDAPAEDSSTDAPKPAEEA